MTLSELDGYEYLDDDRWEDYQEYPDESTLGDFDCLFGDRCLIPGEHYTSECCDAEMMEAVQ